MVSLAKSVFFSISRLNKHKQRIALINLSLTKNTIQSVERTNNQFTKEANQIFLERK